MISTEAPARSMWHLLEPLHAVLYYAPEAFEEAGAIGYPTEPRWPSYFAWRAAPLGVPDPLSAADPLGAAHALGAADPDAVATAFYSFSPHLVRRHVPAVWAVASPAVVLAARHQAVDRALRAILGDGVDTPELIEAASLARRAARDADITDRPLAAANAALPWPDEPHLVLWHAATVLREHRGDGHVSALRAAGLDPCEALVSFAATGAAPVEVFASRGWTDREWAEARERLAARGLVDADGLATALGRRLREDVERHTDELAAAPWSALGPATGRLAQLVMPLMRAVVDTGLLPARSTLGIRR